MEVLTGVHQIEVNYKNRPLHLHLLRFGDESMLIDVGDNGTPRKDILPYFETIGFDPHALTHVLLTHPDIDHVGGIHALKEIAPQAQFMCGTLDREEIETPEGLAAIRARAHYHWHGLGPDDAKLAAFIQNAGGAGKRLPMARTFSFDEDFELGGGSIKILHLPGHSRGHLGVCLPWENAAIIGDAVQHAFAPLIDGTPAMPTTYMYVDAYLGSIAKLKSLGLERLFSGHWPNGMTALDVEQFLVESREYCLRAEEAVLETVRSAGDAGLTLKEICLRAKPKLGAWPADRDVDARSIVCGHLQRLDSLGFVRMTDERPTRYIIEGTWRRLR